jgi:hypothetical protein
VAQQPLVGQGLLINEASRSHSGTPHAVGLLWTSDQPEAETSTWQHTTLKKRQTSPEGFEPAIPTSERPQTYALDRTATEVGVRLSLFWLNWNKSNGQAYFPGTSIRISTFISSETFLMMWKVFQVSFVENKGRKEEVLIKWKICMFTSWRQNQWAIPLADRISENDTQEYREP